MQVTDAIGTNAEGPGETAHDSAPFSSGSESGANGDVRGALASLTSKSSRDASGRFVAGNTARVTTGERSAAQWSALELLKADVVRRVRADLGVLNDDAAQTLAGVVDAYAEAHLLRASMFVRLVEQGGPVTAKGKQRALYAAYTRALEQEVKLAQLLGLERKARALGTLDPREYLRRQQPATTEGA